MGLFDDLFDYDQLFENDPYGGNDWSLPVGSETGGDFSVDDVADTGSWFDDLFGDTPYSGSSSDFFDIYGDTPIGDDNTSWLDDLFGDTPYSGSSSDFFDTYGDTPIGGGSTSWFDDLLAETEEDTEIPGGDEGPLGGQFGPWLRNLFLGSGQGGEGSTGGILGALFGGGGGGGLFGGGEGGEGGLGGLMGGNPLMQFLMMKSLLKDDKSASGTVPIGGEAYGGPKFNYQDYQATNLTPALMPGVGYANMGPPPPPPDVGVPEVPGMMHGGDVRPGDITFAKLEPGEFVIQKPAVDAVGIETLEKINNMGNGGSYHG
mgnify:CR=1 FL=1